MLQGSKKKLPFCCCGKAESWMASELFDEWVQEIDKTFSKLN